MRQPLKPLQLIYENMGTTNPRANLPTIVTLSDLQKIPDNSIVWYPEHGTDYGAFLTADLLKQYIKEQQINPGASEPSTGLFTKMLAVAKSFGLTSPDLVSEESAIIIVMDEEGDGEDPNTYTQLNKFVARVKKQGLAMYYVPYDHGEIREYWQVD